MKRSMIAVCLMLLSPERLMACIEDHNSGAGWIDQQPSSWSHYSTWEQVAHRNSVQDISLFVGGMGLTILTGAFYRATRRAMLREQFGHQPADCNLEQG